MGANQVAQSPSGDVRESRRVGSNRVIRYGYENKLYRVLSVALNDNVSCAKRAPLHRIDAVSVSDGLPAMWWIRDAELGRYV